MTAERIAALQAAIAAGRVGPGSMNFAQSLLRQYARSARLSATQWAWVERLIAGERSAGPAAPAVTDGPALEDVAPLYDWMNAARVGGLAAPVLRFASVRLSLPGPTSRFRGTRAVYVASTPNGSYLGRWEGTSFYPSVHFQAASRTSLVLALNAIVADPRGSAIAYARRTSSCCFCGLALTDERSVRHGYGPICAGRYSLPWDAPRTARGGPRLRAPRTAAGVAAQAAAESAAEASMENAAQRVPPLLTPDELARRAADRIARERGGMEPAAGFMEPAAGFYGTPEYFAHHISQAREEGNEARVLELIREQAARSGRSVEMVTLAHSAPRERITPTGSRRPATPPPAPDAPDPNFPDVDAEDRRFL